MPAFETVEVKRHILSGLLALMAPNPYFLVFDLLRQLIFGLLDLLIN